ncbi:type II/III secretion system protein [Legionella qingyii]|uniref:Type II/III secretion system protein n=1 Tax=Legionella qingyii TaxID=2184757 RepID=A0A317U3B7_9GAMM|nr:type II/III secretion system protein [Legionella qingyii]PWY55337.1 type II/III secretion system protein [Legionella qingyii]RUR21262.1 type II/III secretion system protein [Legionella qingyii]RUR23947.1 type II/III secretion system protein [Legionella qingyii]
MKRFWLIGLLLLANNVFSQTITKVIELHYVPVQKVIQLVQPLLQPGEKISGSDQTLVVQVSPQTLTQIRTVLHQIDVPPVTFNISIYQGDPNWLSAQNENSVTYSSNSPAEAKRTQSVKVMNGESAFVSTDQEVPIITAVGAGFFTGIAYQQHQIKNGLLVQPVMRGSQVELKLRRVREQQDPAGDQQFDNQNIDTTLMVPLNKWVSLGSPEGTQDTDSSSVSYTAGRPFSQQATLYVKVSVAGNL